MGRTGIIGAMEEEVALLKEKMEIEVVVKRHPWNSTRVI